MTYTGKVDRVFVFTVIRSPHPPFASQTVPLLHGRRLSRAFLVCAVLPDKLKFMIKQKRLKRLRDRKCFSLVFIIYYSSPLQQ